MIGGIGTAYFMTPFYAYIPILYPLNVERIKVGPILGSFLFGLGGYVLPFMVLFYFDFAILPLLAYG